MRTKHIYFASLAVIGILGFGCSRTIQSDKSIKEERSSAAESGPVIVTATVRMNDGTPLRNRGLHLITISRDDKGDMNQVDQLLTITSTTDANGNLRFPVPRDRIAGVKELSFGLNPSDPYGPPAVIRRKEAKEILSFKADEKTRSVDLGEVVVPLR